MRRPLRVELFRGTAPAAALATAGGTVWMLGVHTDAWAGLAGYFRSTLLVLCALMVAAGAWQAGRERRRAMGEMLTSTARPAWQPMLVAWFAVALGGTIGTVSVLGGAAVLIAPVATYVGQGWWWGLLVGLLALWTAAALGVLVGRLVPFRAIAPVAGLATFVGLGAGTYLSNDRVAWLSPVQDTDLTAGQFIPGELHLTQAVWLLALTAALLALAARLRWTTLLTVTLAATAAVPFLTGPRIGRLPTDSRAIEPVCTVDGPPVCVARINAFILDDVATVTQPLLARMTRIPGAPIRVADLDTLSDGQYPEDHVDTVWLNLSEQPRALGGLARGDSLRRLFGRASLPTCDALPEEADRTQYVAREWLTDEPQPVADLPTDQLRALPPDQQRAWFGEYLAAARDCDQEHLVQLGERL
ncbi:hypothetical protein BDK92_0665 [Micromonospora pisi]|uniref:Uncharacterized protein n=1 Tax=Micromonospora pisi TaxID=589240 RepID=A0A495JEE1_9ACTN|nr:hypothetical protein [Micromonospora pisi]RKR86439.1 hypothetical protein BDK92_0665 [Micromonospora pisi]